MIRFPISSFNIRTDRLNTPSTVARGNIEQLTTVSTLDEVSIGTTSNSIDFIVGSAAVFTLGSMEREQTFLALSDDIEGAQASIDEFIEMTGFSGFMENLSIL